MNSYCVVYVIQNSRHLILLTLEIMDKALRPDQFDCLPNTPVSTKEFSHCFKLFQDFLNVLPQRNLDKLTKLTYFLNQTMYVLILNVQRNTTLFLCQNQHVSKAPTRSFLGIYRATKSRKYNSRNKMFIKGWSTMFTIRRYNRTISIPLAIIGCCNHRWQP